MKPKEKHIPIEELTQSSSNNETRIFLTIDEVEDQIDEVISILEDLKQRL